MSKERELLEEIISGDEVGDFYLTENMFMKIRELLAQPKQEPIGEIDLSGNTVGIGAPFLAVKWVTGMMPSIGTKLYTSPQNRNPEQEPVAWMYDWNTKGDEQYGNSYYDRVSSDEMAIKRCACGNIRPLYTSPPKRKSLSDDEITDIHAQLVNNQYLTFLQLARILEKAMGAEK